MIESDLKTFVNAKLLKNEAAGFFDLAKKVFDFQSMYSSVYKAYIEALAFDKSTIRAITDFPFLPISFYKSHQVTAYTGSPDIVFESSGTTGMQNSRHYIRDLEWYHEVSAQIFQHTYGSPSDWCILGLLPSYLERKNSSLVSMVRMLMDRSGHADNGFYLNDFHALSSVLTRLQQKGQKAILFGVSFALIDFATAYPMTLPHLTIVETGGMKGRKEEITREQLHEIIAHGIQGAHIHSEYGMTELLSQSYATNGFDFPVQASLRALVREVNDPFAITETGTGILNLIDLANIESCSFIATEDIGTVNADNSFRVLGRMDHASLRGCSMLAL